MRDISLLPQYTTVTCQTMCPGGSFYSACTESGMISVWEVDSLLSNSSPKPLLSFTAHGGEPIYSLTSTENFLISGGLGEVRGWCWNGFKTKTEKPAWSFHVGATGRPTQINWIDLDRQAGSSGRVYVGCSDGNIYIYDLETRRLDKVLSGHTQFVHCVAGADGSGGVSLISGGEDGDVKLWDTRKSNALIHSFSPYLETELNRPECGRFISTVCTAGDWLVCGGGPAASLWNLSTRIMSSRLPPDHGAVLASNLVEDQILIAGQNPMLHTSNFGGETCSAEKVSSGCTYSIVAQEEKGIILTAGSSTIIDIFSLKNQEKIKSFSIK